MSCFSPDRQSGYHLNIFGWIFIFLPGAAAFPFLRYALPHCPPEASTSFLRGASAKNRFHRGKFRPNRGQDSYPDIHWISAGQVLVPRRLEQRPKPQQKSASGRHFPWRTFFIPAASSSSADAPGRFPAAGFGCESAPARTAPAAGRKSGPWKGCPDFSAPAGSGW